jgi:hypothetical protein
MKTVFGVAAAGLFLWIGGMFALGPGIQFGDGQDEIDVRCSPQVYYLNFDYDYDDLDSRDGVFRQTFTVTKGQVSNVGSSGLSDVYREIDTACDRARTSQAATMALLAAPTAVLAILALRPRRMDEAVVVTRT